MQRRRRLSMLFNGMLQPGRAGRRVPGRSAPVLGDRRSRPRAAVAAVAVTVLGAVLTPVAPAMAAVTPAAGIQLKAASSGRCINVRGALATNDIPIVQYNCAASFVNDKFKAVPKGDGTYQLVAVFSNKCLDVKGALLTDNTPIVQYTCSVAAKNDRWRFRAVPDRPTFQIVAEHSGKCIHVSGAKLDNDIPLVQFTCGSTPALNEQWTFAPTDSATPRPVPVPAFTPVVAVQGASTAPIGPLAYAFVDNGGRAWRAFQESPDDFSSIQWAPVAGLEQFAGQPQISTQADGRVQVVVHNAADGDVWLSTQTAKGRNTYYNWADVGGATAYHPALGRMPDGKLVIFSLVAGGGLWHLPQDGTNVPYAGWRYIGGTGLTGTPAIVTLRDSLRIFALDGNGSVQTAVYRAGALSDWTNLGGSGLNGTPSAVVYPGYRVRVFARDAGGAIVAKAERTDGTFEPDWSPVGDTISAGPPAAVLDPISGVTDVVARSTDGRVYAVSETAQASGQWGSWHAAGDRIVATDPTVVTFTRTGGQVWGYVTRDVNNVPYLVTKDGIGPAAVRGTASSQFRSHALPRPPA